MQGKHPEAIVIILLDSTQAKKPGWYWAYGTNSGAEFGIVTYSNYEGPYNSAAEAMMHVLADMDETTSS